jgi:cyclin L
MATTAASMHVVLPAVALARSPSREDGVSEAVEQDHRFWGCEIIEEAGILLRLPQVVMVTAQTMLHRFYYRKSLRDFDAFRVAIGCLFLAAKVEEQPKRIKDVLSVFYAIYRRRKWHKTKLAHQLLELESESYDLWRDWLIMVERQILIDLGFSLYNIMEHPHKYILYYIKILDGTEALAQKAWGFLNDSLRIDLCVRFHAEAIACAAIFLAARQLQIKLPDAPAWYELFNVDREALVAVSREILLLYRREKIVWLDALTKVDPFAIDDLPDVDAVAISSKGKMDDQETVPTPVAAERVQTHQSVGVTETKNTTRASRFSDTKESPQRERPSSSSTRGRSRDRELRRERSRGRDRSRDRDQRSGRSHRRSRSRSEERRSSRSSRRDRNRRSSRSRSRGQEDDQRRGRRPRSRSRR